MAWLGDWVTGSVPVGHLVGWVTWFPRLTAQVNVFALWGGGGSSTVKLVYFSFQADRDFLFQCWFSIDSIFFSASVWGSN